MSNWYYVYSDTFFAESPPWWYKVVESIGRCVGCGKVIDSWKPRPWNVVVMGTPHGYGGLVAGAMLSIVSIKVLEVLRPHLADAILGDVYSASDFIQGPISIPDPSNPYELVGLTRLDAYRSWYPLGRTVRMKSERGEMWTCPVCGLQEMLVRPRPRYIAQSDIESATGVLLTRLGLLVVAGHVADELRALNIKDMKFEKLNVRDS